MDESGLSSLMLIIGLIFADALVTLAYATLINKHGDEDMTEDANRRLQLTGQISITLLRFAIAGYAMSSFAEPLALRWDVPLWLGALAILLPLSIITLILAEIVPSSVGAAYSEQLAGIMNPLMRAMLFTLAPITWITYQTSSIISRTLGGKEVASTLTEEELITLINTGQTFEDDERKMIHSVLQLDETTVTEMMIPRIDIVALEKDESIAEARKVFLESGHSRLPVYDENIDNIVGVCYVKDLLEVWHNGDTVVGSVAEIIRPAHFVPETLTADQLLHEFQRNKVHMAIVVEEYGGTSGLVTLENLLEEIVGDIQDEYDTDEPEEFFKVSETEYRVDAGIVLDDLNDMLDVNLEDEDVDTLGGFILNQLERVPEPGETIMTEELELTVLSVEGRRIRDVQVVKRDLDGDEDSDEKEIAQEKHESEAPRSTETLTES